MKNIVKSGLLINDICHYLPVSVIFDCQIKRKKEEHCNRYVRVRTGETRNKFKNYLKYFLNNGKAK